MKKRSLGASGIEIAPLILGGNVFGWTADERTSFELLDGFIAAGFNCIDTADVYSRWVPGNQGGESETIIGRWMKARKNRDRVIIATKVGMDMGPAGKGLSRAHIFKAVENSLRRLQTDTIDLYQSHREDPETPLEETLDAYGMLIRQGKVRTIGASNYTPERLTEALELSRTRGLPRYESLQPLYNLYDRAEFEAKLLPLCRDSGVGVIPYYGLASGFLTGKYRSSADFSKSARGERMKEYLNDRGRRILSALDQVASQKSATPGEIALAWLMQRPGITAPIASARTVEQLRELVRSAEVELDADSVRILDSASE